MSPPRTLSEAQRRFAEASAEFRKAKSPDELDDLAAEIRGLRRLIAWLRAKEARAA